VALTASSIIAPEMVGPRDLERIPDLELIDRSRIMAQA
jgi:hypothetical protein